MPAELSPDVLAPGVLAPGVLSPVYDCQSCGACCSTSAEWPRFSLESDEELARIPEALVDDARGRMRCEGDRCAALSGQVGRHTACTIYDIRPLVCRDCEPGDEVCLIARRHFGL